MLLAVTSPAPPAATPGGRALVKLPVAYTVLLTTTWLQTTPLICQVGNTSALTVAGTPAAGPVSANAASPGPNPAQPSPQASATVNARRNQPALPLPPIILVPLPRSLVPPSRQSLSLIHISEPTRRTPISYAV